MSSTENRKQELRKFGLLVGTIFLCLGLFPLTKGKVINHYFFVPGTVLCLLGIIYPLVLSPFHAVWMKIGHVLGRINSFLILSVIFYLIFTPTRMLLLLFSKERKFDFRTGSESYWIKRSPDDFRETMKRQF